VIKETRIEFKRAIKTQIRKKPMAGTNNIRSSSMGFSISQFQGFEKGLAVFMNLVPNEGPWILRMTWPMKRNHMLQFEHVISSHFARTLWACDFS